MLERSAETQDPGKILSHYFRAGSGSRCYSGIQIDGSSTLFNTWRLRSLWGLGRGVTIPDSWNGESMEEEHAREIFLILFLSFSREGKGGRQRKRNNMPLINALSRD